MTPEEPEATPEEAADVERWLAAAPTPRMPAAVAARLDRVLVAEVARRDELRVAASADPERLGRSGGPGRPVGLGSFGSDLARKPIRRYLVPVLAAAALAFAVGFGAYVVSASAGLNEPPVVASVTSASLAAQAGALERNGDLTPHRFSRAWQCARQATEGRIVALASSTVDGVPALLVYTRSGAGRMVTVVTGCGTGRPTAATSTPITR